MSIDPDFITLEDRIRRFLMTDRRFLEDLRVRVDENAIIRRQLEEYNGLEGYISRLSSGEYIREDAFTATILLVEGALQHLLVTRTLIDRIIVRQNAIYGKVGRVETALHSEVIPKLDTLERALENVLADLRGEILRSQNLILVSIVTLTRRVERGFADLSTSILNELTQLRNHLDEALGNLETNLREAIIAARNAIVGSVAGTEGVILEAVGFVDLTVKGIFAIVTGMSTLLGVELPLIKHSVSRVAPNIQSFLKDPYLDKIEERMREVVKDLARDISEETSLKIVGTSYYRWDSQTSYYPTLTFLFKETGVANYPRQTQIQARLKIKGVDLTREDIDRLKQQTPRQLPMAYKHGFVRGNYVSKTKDFKTTIFGDSRDDVVEILRKVCIIVEEDFQPANLSYTEGRRRASHTRRTVPLGDVEPLAVDYSAIFNVSLYRVVLLVNGLERPITLYP